MPRRDLNEHFDSERPEWTKRKHAILAGYVVAAAMKMRNIRGSIALIDGYAGANSYGEEATGSTVITANAARGVRAQGNPVTVFACEPDRGRYKELVSNLAEDVESGLVRPLNTTHAEAVPLILSEIGTEPAFAFLDPQAVTQMTLEGDIYPWLRRERTDLLGVFMASQACRCSAQLVKGGPNQDVHPSRYLGADWERGATEDGAMQSLTISGLKVYILCESSSRTGMPTPFSGCPIIRTATGYFPTR